MNDFYSLGFLLGAVTTVLTAAILVLIFYFKTSLGSDTRK